MNDSDVLIIGAGAAGLVAATELAKRGRKVVLMEARNRIGGRIFTEQHQDFIQPIERGAEFIHGKLPVTIKLLKKGGIKYHAIKGKMWRIIEGEPEKTTAFIEDWAVLLKELKKLKDDVPIAYFLDTHFKDEKYKELKQSVLQYVQGYDAADAHKASSIALRTEWEAEDTGHQYRIEGGYIKLMRYLEEEVIKEGGAIYLSSVATTIEWQKNKVTVHTVEGKLYNAKQVLITVPLGILQAEENKAARLQFSPPINKYIDAARKMGFGAVVKVNIQFKQPFWETAVKHKIKSAGFIFSDAEIPTWWTQNPVEDNTLTGWLAGPYAANLKNATDDIIHKKAVTALAYIFAIDQNFILEQATAYVITNWAADSFALGAYSYATIDTDWALKIFKEPIENTVFFAGEAFYEGTETGTVEGALANGINVAQRMIQLAEP